MAMSRTPKLWQSGKYCRHRIKQHVQNVSIKPQNRCLFLAPENWSRYYRAV